ncbi:neutral zinc metallopeptidase [Aerococcaceae bacterium 50-4]
MKWEGRKRSGNVKDLRGKNTSRGGFGQGRSGGGRIPIPLPGGGGRNSVGRSSIGCGSIFLILILFFVFGGTSLFGGNQSSPSNNQPGQIDVQLPGQMESNTQIQESPNSQVSLPETAATNEGTVTEDELAEFVSVILYDTEAYWGQAFSEAGYTYENPELVIFEDAVNSSCGHNTSEVGPFYCPIDETIYIDLDFYNQLVQNYGGGGDFAMAYVIAHEVGHHVQQQLNITNQVRQIQSEVGQTEQNQWTVRMELQADYLAGVWANNVVENGWMEEGDLEEGLNAAFHIGDDVLQEKAYGYTMPDSFTHGTAEQRQNWFKKGLQTGDLSQWDTYNVSYDSL